MIWWSGLTPSALITRYSTAGHRATNGKLARTRTGERDNGWEIGMTPERGVGAMAALIFYLVTGLAFHLIAFGEVDWTGAFVYVVIVLWPVFLAWEVLKILVIVALVVLAGLAVYALMRAVISAWGR